MDIRLQTTFRSKIRTDCLILPAFAGETPASFAGPMGESLAWLRDGAFLNDHSGKKDQLTVCYGPAGATIPRALLLGLGPRKDATPDAFRQALGAAARRCKSLRLARTALYAGSFAPIAAALGKSEGELLAEAVLACILAVYRCTAYRSAGAKAEAKKDDDTFFSPDTLVVLHDGKTAPAALRGHLRRAEAEGAGICLARELVNGPPNIITPARMAEEAQALAKRYGFNCRVLRRADMEQSGMDALLAVAKGSHTDPRFIVLEYMPKNAKKRAPLVLAGKGITFDTGGISLKPPAGMHEMKGDMAGAAAVLGVFEAIGHLSELVVQPVVGLLPCVENMPGGGSFRPGDIVTTMSGKTVEILNTDAEGRLILCDTLAYAQKNWKPSALVDVATLTGACVVALGPYGGAVFSDDTALRETLVRLGTEAGDLLWPMPLWENLRSNLKSAVADMTNVGSREGGAIIAGLFLKSFVSPGLPWAHLDIAGPGFASKETALCPEGGTGFGVRVLYALARHPLERAAGKKER